MLTIFLFTFYFLLRDVFISFCVSLGFRECFMRYFSGFILSTITVFRCNVSLRGNGLKVLTSNSHIPVDTAVIECRGKYMLNNPGLNKVNITLISVSFPCIANYFSDSGEQEQSVCAAAQTQPRAGGPGGRHNIRQ